MSRRKPERTATAIDVAATPNNPDRNPQGHFAKGNSLAGNKAGSRHRVTRSIEALLEGQHEALTEKAVALALQGDTVALRLCLDRLAPARRDSPVAFDLPPVRSAADIVAASSALLAAVAGGEVTPDEAGRIMALLSAHRAIVDTGDIETRLSALESRVGGVQ